MYYATYNVYAILNVTGTGRNLRIVRDFAASNGIGNGLVMLCSTKGISIADVGKLTLIHKWTR